jgi:type IV pilus assembly protein PilA
MHKLWQRLQRDEGFTLIELLVVIVIIGILLAIAVPSYLGFRGRAQDSAAKANIRAAVPSAEAFYSENNTYTGMNVAGLKATYDSGLKTSGPHAVSLAGAVPDDDSYCLTATGKTGNQFKFEGPGGEVVAGTCT